MATSKEALNATGLGGSGRQAALSALAGDSDVERGDDETTSQKLLKNDVVEFMFEQEDESRNNKRVLGEHHASVVPESEEKHSDTTQ